MPSGERGNSLMVGVVYGERNVAIKIGSDAGLGRELVTVDEARSFAIEILRAVDTAERWKPPESEQKKRARRRKQKQLTEVVA